MSHDLICSWLELPLGNWPPDHYTLLGVKQGDELPRIEQQVHQRMERVRRYQLTHPEPATEAMNRLAQAFVCLSDPTARQAYDRSLFGPPPDLNVRPEVTPPTAAARPTPQPPAAVLTPPVLPAALARTQIDFDTPPLAVGTVATLPGEPAPGVPVEPPLPPPPGSKPPRQTTSQERVEAAAAAAVATSAARRGLGTKRALYQRIAATRALMRAWQEASKYLAWPKRRLTKQSEAAELVSLLTHIRDRLRGFPRLLGEAGQPGYLVVSLARQQAIVPTFQTLLSSQREALARDWWAGTTVLSTYQQYLRKEVRQMRKKSIWAWTARASLALVTDQPAKLLLLLALIALNVAWWRFAASKGWLPRWPSWRAPAPPAAVVEPEPEPESN